MTKTRILGLAIAMLAVALGSSSCQTGDVVNDAINELGIETSLYPQQWTSAQTQGKRQLFPKETSYRLQRMLGRNVGSHKLPGLVLYIATSDGVWMGTAGLSNVEAQTPLKPTDRFRLGPLTQTFVAIVTLQLMEEGQLNLDAAIATYLPSSVRTSLRGSQDITVRQLLNHTSGLPSPYSPAFEQAVQANPTHKWTASELLGYVYDQKAAELRGLSYTSDTNYLLLQLIIERVTGHSLTAEIQQRILQPLGLKNTFMELQAPKGQGFAQGYQGWDDQGTAKNVTKPLLNTGLGLGNAGLISNAADLSRLFQALFSENTLLRPSTLEAMLDHVGDRERQGYGLGILYKPTVWGESWGQMGRTTGFSVAVEYLPVHDLTIVAWTNTGDEQSADVPLEILERSLDIILGNPKS